MGAMPRVRCDLVACMTGPGFRSLVSRTGVIPRRECKIVRYPLAVTPAPLSMCPTRLLHGHSWMESRWRLRTGNPMKTRHHQDKVTEAADLFVRLRWRETLAKPPPADAPELRSRDARPGETR